MVNTPLQNITGTQHFILMLAASYVSVFLCAIGIGFPIALNIEILATWFVLMFFVHCMAPLLFFLYGPLTLKYWQIERRKFFLFLVTGLWVAVLNGIVSGVLVRGMPAVMRGDMLDWADVFWLVPIYTICGLMTGALHWLFLTRAQRKLEQTKADDTP